MLANGLNVEYIIDGQNRRVGRLVNGTPTHRWLYQDQLNPVAELGATGQVTKRFVYGTKPHVPDYYEDHADAQNPVTYRLVTDHLGSVRLVVDVETGTVAQRLDYDAFGRVITDTAPGFQPFAYAGGLYDHQTGLVRFGARDYDAKIGRWTSKDPVGFEGQDTNLYRYVFADPVNLVDPTGESAIDWLQGGLDVFGLIPGLGEPADGINGLISLARGDCLGAALSFAAMVPIGGQLATLGKAARRGIDLSASQADNLRRFSKKLPSGNTGVDIDSLGDGLLFTAEVPGRVPGSKAVYQKVVDASGATTNFVKTTIDPQGNIVHVKNKL